jgi:hypothetical protein
LPSLWAAYAKILATIYGGLCCLCHQFFIGETLLLRRSCGRLGKWLLLRSLSCRNKAHAHNCHKKINMPHDEVENTIYGAPPEGDTASRDIRRSLWFAPRIRRLYIWEPKSIIDPWRYGNA